MSNKQQIAKATGKDKEMTISKDRPTWMKPATEGISRGNENVQTADLVIPRVEIVQDLSPVKKKHDPAYIQGAEEGMMYNTVTRHLYGRTMLVVPVLFRKEFLIWKDRDKGGGFRGAYPEEAVAQTALRGLPPEDQGACEIVDTAQQFCLAIDSVTGAVEEVVISMSRTKMKVSRKWNSLIRLAGDDRFARVYQLSTVHEKNPKGEFYNYDVSQLGFCPEHIFTAAEALYESVRQGRTIEADRTFEDEGAIPNDDDGRM